MFSHFDGIRKLHVCGALKFLADRVGGGASADGVFERSKGAGGFKEHAAGNQQTGGEILLLPAPHRTRKTGLRLPEGARPSDTIRKFGLAIQIVWKPAVPFLKEKGYDDEILRQSGLSGGRVHGMQDKFWNRVLPDHGCQQPCHRLRRPCDGDGKADTWSPRTKDFRPTAISTGCIWRALHGEKSDYLRAMDVISYQAGFNNAVALNSTHIAAGGADETVYRRGSCDL